MDKSTRVASLTLTHFVPLFSLYTSRKHTSSQCVKIIRIWNYSGPYSVRMRENMDQNNSEYGHLLRSVCFFHFRDYRKRPMVYNIG